MKKVDVLNGLNDIMDNTCGEKKILDGCKYCMAVNRMKCSKAASEVRERMDEKEVVACIELVSGLVETAKAYGKIDKVYMDIKECMDNE